MCVLIRKEQQCLVCWNVSISHLFQKERGSELLPMFLIASLAFSFLIAIHANTVRFHHVIVLYHIFIFSLDFIFFFWLQCMQELTGKHLILPLEADNFFANKDPISTNNLGEAKQRASPPAKDACSNRAAPHQATWGSWMRSKHATRKGMIKHC